ncbi:penicillin-binding transpeptidase domain-containing protein [Leptospira sp. WS92.C1]
MLRGWILFVSLWVLVSAKGIYSKEITLFSHFTDSSPSVTGERILLKQTFTPASTFKYWIVLFLLEQNLVSPDLKMPSSETHIPNSPRDLNLRDAMFYSSNSFFLSFLKDDLQRYSQLEDTLIRIGFVSGKFKKPFLDKKNVYFSKAILVSPEFQHNFMVEFLKDEGGSKNVSPKTFRLWKDAAFWSFCDSQNSIVYGKTGSLGGAFWFLGFLEKRQSFLNRLWNGSRKKEYTVITVLQTGEGANREGAIRSFYRSAGCEGELDQIGLRISE